MSNQTICKQEQQLESLGVFLKGDVLDRYRAWAKANPNGGTADGRGAVTNLQRGKSVPVERLEHHATRAAIMKEAA